MENVESDLRQRLAKVSGYLWDKGLVHGSSGNVSARIPGSDMCIIKPSGFKMCDLKPEDFIVVNINTLKVLKGKYKPSIETPFHTIIYRVRKDVGGVVHTHSHYGTILGIAGVRPLPMGMIFYDAPLLARGIGMSKYAQPGTEKLAQNVVSVFANKYAVLMPQHGLVAVGKTIEEAFTNADGAEELAKLQYEVMLIGKPRPLPKSILKEFLKMKPGQG